MNKWLVIILIAFTWYVADFALNEHTAQINVLQEQVSQLTTELQTTKAEMIQLQLQQCVSEDISDRAGWK